MRKVKWVSSYRDIPNYEQKELGSSLKGYHDPRTDTIYLIRGKASRVTEQHELYHSIRKDPDKPRSPKDFVVHEIRADLYSYKKIGQPVHVKGTLGGIYWSLKEMYGLSSLQAVKVVGSIIRGKAIPNTWKNDWLVIKKRIYERHILDR